MTELQKEFEKMGCVSWINSSLYPDSKYYTEAYTLWLEKQVLELREKLMPELSDNEIEAEAEKKFPDMSLPNTASLLKQVWIDGGKSYRQQLKKETKGNNAENCQMLDTEKLEIILLDLNIGRISVKVAKSRILKLLKYKDNEKNSSRMVNTTTNDQYFT